MQSLEWYTHRLRSMSLPEMLWRAEDRVRHALDRLVLPARSKPLPASRLVNGQGRAGLIDPAMFGDTLPRVGAGTECAAGTEGAAGAEGAEGESRFSGAWLSRALTQADRIAAHRLTIFDLEDHDLGAEIDWNLEPKAGKQAPMIFAADIDYRDYSVTGDCKFVWEPNRHHQLVTAARAYRLTGDERYASVCLDQMTSWLDQCPFGVGMNWRSPLELGIRLINWVWTLELIRPAGVAAERTEDQDRIAVAAYRHLWEISRKYSRHSSANNHLIGEAAGVFIGSSYFAGLRGAAQWRARARGILIREIFNQTYPDGGTREQAFGYHLFVTQFFLLAGLAGRNAGDDFPLFYWQRLEKLFEFVAAFLEGGSPPMFGDCDDGYVLDLGDRLGEPRALMAVGAVLYDRPDFKVLAGGFHEPAYWLLGDSARRRFDEIDAGESHRPLRSRALPGSGYYLLQCGRIGQRDAMSVVFDCGELGFKSIAAHGHADALSVTVRAGGADVLVDPGTYDYFTYRAWRDYFRSTRAHNTIEIDGQDQSVALGPFMWGRRADVRCVRWDPRDGGGTVVGEHDGYRRLDDPVMHRRAVTVEEGPRRITIRDELLAAGRHEGALRFHLAEQCRVTPAGANRYEVDYGAGTATIEFDERVRVSVVAGAEEPIGGWVSRAYHRRTPAATLVARFEDSGVIRLRTRITFA